MNRFSSKMTEVKILFEMSATNLFFSKVGGIFITISYVKIKPLVKIQISPKQHMMHVWCKLFFKSFSFEKDFSLTA